MKILNKLIESLKTKDSGSILWKRKETLEEYVSRRKSERAAFRAEFCLFAEESDDGPDMEVSPFILAHLENISAGGAGFSCDSLRAHTPFQPEREKEIVVGSKVWLIRNAQETPSSCGGCSQENREEADNPLDGSGPVLAKIVWIKDRKLGCSFIRQEEAFKKAVDQIVKATKNHK